MFHPLPETKGIASQKDLQDIGLGSWQPHTTSPTRKATVYKGFPMDSGIPASYENALHYLYSSRDGLGIKAHW